MNKKTPRLLRSLSVILSAAVLTGSLSSGVQTVWAESADIDFISSAEEEPSLDDVDLIEEDLDDPQEATPDTDTAEDTDAPSDTSSDFSQNTADELFSSDADDLFSSGTDDDEPDYILGRPMTEEERQEQLAMMTGLKQLTPMAEADSDFSTMPHTAATYASFPKVYDSRKKGLVSPVKYQNPFGICWAFSMASNMETSLLAQNLGCWDLSEEHLAYFLAHRTNDPLRNTPNDRFIHKGMDYHDGGNSMIASFFLSTWSGMTTEDKVPLPTDEYHIMDYSAYMVPNKNLAYDTSVYMKDAIFSQYDKTRTKALLSEYGSVAVMMYMDDSGMYYNPDTAASCFPYSDYVNHAVTLVGWNDNYSKKNFGPYSGVRNNGAWIVKNSYDTDWGDNGYFYISYEDQSLCNLVCHTATTQQAYPNNYFYDGANPCYYTFSCSPGYSIANVFTAKAGNGNYEQLGEIVAASSSDNATYQIQIYTDLRNPKDPTSGTPAYAKPFKYTQELAGIDTITLPTPVQLNPRSKFSVVLTLVGSPIDYYIERSVDFGWIESVSGINTGQSFYTKNSKNWKDVATTSNPYCFSIKAHTKTLNTAPTPVPDKYQIFYDENTDLETGNIPSDEKLYSRGETVKIKEAPYCTSRFFAGWNTRADGKGTLYLPGQNIKIKGNVTLYAQWQVSHTTSSLIYRVTGKQTVTCYGTSNSRLGKAVIPLTIKYAGATYKVTSVWSKAFANKKKLSSVVIGHNVSAIGSQAFYNCRNLKTVTIGTGLTRIGSQAFRNVKTKCVITIKSTRLTTVSSKIDQGVKKMTVRVPKAKYSAYNRLLRKHSKTVLVKRF